jgi:rhodanese-related sulfurtransferase
MKKSVVSFDSAQNNPQIGGVLDVTAEEIVKKTQMVHLVDVRGPDEYIGELGHILGSQLMVLDTLADRINELPKDETIVFVCRSGARSAHATAFALGQGFQHVYNLKGGMIRWNDLGYEIAKK